MARPKKTIPTVYHNIGLPEDLAVKLKLHLFSEVEDKVPMGAQQNFFTKLVRDFFREFEAGQAAHAEAAARVARENFKAHSLESQQS